MWIYILFVTVDTRVLQDGALIKKPGEGKPAEERVWKPLPYRPMADRNLLLAVF
jgi:hypothetical protein